MDGYTQIPTDIQDSARGKPTCSSCGSAAAFEPGFIEDAGQGSQGYTKWIPGGLEKGIFGGASRFGRERYDITGQRCTVCGHLDLFAN